MNELGHILRGGACLTIALGLVSAQTTTTMTYRQTGSLVGATASVAGAFYQASVNIAPVLLSEDSKDLDQERYYIYWNTTVYGGALPPPVCLLPTDPPPPPADMVSTSVFGFVPPAAIQRLPSGALSLDLDLNKLQHPYIMSTQCASGICNPIQPTDTSSVLKGTFTPVTSGPGTFSSSSSGDRSTLNIDPVCRSQNSYNGYESNTAARFAGQIGDIAVPDTTIGSNAQLKIQRGQWTQTFTCTPPPPPPPPLD